ncbi:MAG TPA: pyridoxamine 5'-phosphate oxidase family protein [Stenotrophomonas sp.]|jgi:general stress protein 26
MADESELREKFWKTLKSDRTVMLGVDGSEDGHSRPMTAMIEGDEGGPIWFFTARDNALVSLLQGTNRRAIATLAGKGHDLFASIAGDLREQTDRAIVDRLWNPFIAAWYEGKDDPKLVLLRLDPDHAQVWLNASSLLAGAKLLLGADPKKDYQDKVGDVAL